MRVLPSLIQDCEAPREPMVLCVAMHRLLRQAFALKQLLFYSLHNTYRQTIELSQKTMATFRGCPLLQS